MPSPTPASAPPADAAPPPASNVSNDLYEQPGHLIRRAQQIAVSMFYEELPDLTPVQFAVLRALKESPGIDQVTLARRVALDTSTTAELAVRLEAKGWISREVMARRQRRLLLTAEGEARLLDWVPAVHRLRKRMLSSLEPTEQDEFLRLLSKFVHLNNQQSRAPLSHDDAMSASDTGAGAPV